MKTTLRIALAIMALGCVALAASYYWIYSHVSASDSTMVAGIAAGGVVCIAALAPDVQAPAPPLI